MITPKITNLGYGKLWSEMSTILDGGVAPTPSTDVITDLFVNNEQGFYYDPNDLSTLYQDSEGTVPVTDVGQPVGLIQDKSGRNNHAYQTTSASRPILRQNATTGAYYLEFDGIDDFLVTNSIDFTSTDKVSLFAGVRKLSDATRSMLFEFGNIAYKGTFRFESTMTNGSNGMYFGSASTVQVIARLDLSAPTSFVATMYGDVATNSAYLKVNNVVRNTSGKDQTGVNYGNLTMHIGRRDGTSLPFNGHIYSLIGVGRLTTEVETEDVEKELAKRVGVVL